MLGDHQNHACMEPGECSTRCTSFCRLHWHASCCDLGAQGSGGDQTLSLCSNAAKRATSVCSQVVLALQDIAPKEASVWFQMGKIFKRLDLLNEALLHFNHALDLQPSSGDTALIKQAIEKLHVSDDIAEEEI